MTTFDGQQHPLGLVSDYVLGLLDAEAQGHLERHAAACPTCRAAIEQERGLFAVVRTTVASATRPNPARLAALRPALTRKPAARPVLNWQRLAPVTMLLLLILSALSVQLSGGDRPLNDNLRGFLPVTNTPTATATTRPTATITALQPAEQPTSAPEALQPAAPTPDIVALPTPIAALPVRTAGTN